MRTELHQHVIAAVTAIALGSTAVASAGTAPAGWLPAVIALVALGWGVHALLISYLRASKLGNVTVQLSIEQHARVAAERMLEDANAALRDVVRRQESVREEERNRIARDIHDDLGQHLLALKIELSLMQLSTKSADPAVHEMATRIAGNLDLAISSLRAVINDLRPLALEDGLLRAIERQLCEFSRLNGIRHEFKAEPEVLGSALSSGETGAALYRILQESLSNIARHAHATEVKIAVVRSGNRLTMCVQDNGVGMAGQPVSDGCGLPGMQHRARAAGGQLMIQSRPGAGTVLSLTIPLVQTH
jgi:signal transduction histidine kinase